MFWKVFKFEFFYFDKAWFQFAVKCIFNVLNSIQRGQLMIKKLYFPFRSKNWPLPFVWTERSDVSPFFPEWKTGYLVIIILFIKF